MKKTTLLFIASLAVLTTGASAASNNKNESDVVVLPTYTVTTPRTSEAEQQINASLKEFVQQASVPMVIAPELTLHKTQVAHLQAAHIVPALRVAKS